MANLSKLVDNRNATTAKRREERQQDKETASSLRDTSVTEITSDPEKFARYLDMQGDNPSYGAGNIALAMAQLPEATVIHTQGHWRDLGRSVAAEELKNGANVFTRPPSGRGYTLTSVYDIAQTQGKEPRRIQLRDDTKPMEAGLEKRFKGWEADDRLNVPKGIQGMSRQIGGSIERTIAPPQRKAPARSGAER